MKVIFAFIVIIILVGLGGVYKFSGKTPVGQDQEAAQVLSQDIEAFTNRVIADNARDQETSAESDVVFEVQGEELCKHARTEFSCYEEFFEESVKKEGIPAAFATLRAAYQGNDYVRAQCHPLTHVIGRTAAGMFASVGEAYLHGDSFCWSGYYHGVMEGIVDVIGYSNITSSMDSICKDVAAERAYSFDHYNCVHGLGHGVMVLTQNELFDSLEICDNLQDPWERSSCWSGAFMENIIVDNKNHFTKYLNPADPLYPCNAADEQYKGTCYLMQTSYMLKATNQDFAKVFSLCGTAEQAFQSVCYQSLGRDASGHTVSDVARTKAICSMGKDFSQQSNCVIGAAKDFISYHHSDVEAKVLCSSFEDAELQSVCFATAESYVKIL
jgi:hypothetical protein